MLAISSGLPGGSIEHPDLLTMDKLKDGLQSARIRKADLRKQAKGLR
jgi:hypothetical protein